MITDYLSDNPALLSLLVLIAGFVLAGIVRTALNRGLTALDERLASYGSSERGLISPQLVRIASVTAFWTILAGAVVLSLLALNTSTLTIALDNAVTLFGRVVAALAIIGVGYLLGLLARLLIERFGHLSGPAVWLAPGAQWGILTIALIMALSQLRIDTTLVTQLLLVAVAVVSGGLVLAFALGAREFVANLLAASELKRLSVGVRLKVRDIEGTVVEIRDSGFDLDTPEGVVSIPAAVLLKEPVLRTTGEREHE